MGAFKSRTPKSILKKHWFHHPHLGRRRRGCGRGLSFTEMGVRMGYWHSDDLLVLIRKTLGMNGWMSISTNCVKALVTVTVSVTACQTLTGPIDGARTRNRKLLPAWHKVTVVCFLNLFHFFKSHLLQLLNFESDGKFWDYGYRFFFLPWLLDRKNKMWEAQFITETSALTIVSFFVSKDCVLHEFFCTSTAAKFLSESFFYFFIASLPPHCS